MISTDKPIFWQGTKYYGAERLGFVNHTFLLEMHSTPPPKPQGGYFTTIPISTPAFRRENPGLSRRARVVDEGDSIVIYCDHGKPHRILTDREILDTLLSECREQELPVTVSGDA